MNNTIYAPITAKGKSSVYTIRISGPNTLSCLEILKIKKSLKHRQATLCQIFEPNTNNLIDEALVVFFKAPNSFTGEDVCEISLHASNYVIKKFFEILSSISDLRFAKPGEFSQRAFLNGKVSLTQAEGIADLVASETEIQQKQALRELEGKTGKIYDKWREKILSVSSLLEACIDFPEDGLSEKSLILEIEKKIQNLKQEISKTLKDEKVGEKIREGLFIAIAGNPNVGKSTLINTLINREIAIVSHIPGTTRDVIETSLDLDGILAIIADTAGIRDSKNSIEKEGIKRALSKFKNADIKLLILTPNIKLNSQLKENTNKDTLIVLNKIDTISKSELNILIKKLEKEYSSTIIPISLKNKTGINKLIKILVEKAQEIISPNSSTIITRERHRVELKNTLKYLKAFSVLDNIELAAENLRLAANAIGKITGKIRVDDILEQIFSKFCIGK